ncbi:hypothetical protein BV394_16010 (plasmid) [Brevirhabdus pacifica]|uniref:Uncharacterized protein n=1 Tax=Brevirhabdus pacifica TaxID=1267768 RepID=A0A1P8QYC0_9RHOB|nr:hypothetical protein [Brevirhabdus pacifica]APX91398.1 hypothetical protein BV394_16010 [Brevirhabdus pacifica]OWU74202.1 hypothetical protein ATO5_14790 [Loktanella sp. 22II-4b]PJJ78996.1 hypothetical protein CLV77_3155 [Brevirhabdus pacifica]
MKKIVAAGLAAALVALPVSGAYAAEVKPLDATKSTQSLPPVLLGGAGVGATGLIVGAITLLTVVAIVTENNSSGTTR